ncbi:hypothetical protein NQ318_018449 [Aromia moschata]|uniref:Uncharacterized protein n=1 Tax=Aromia moschata TaxID=1265417 RepID=A0AAV8X3N4_9CUCU|nr:hypothetical protein NQ318_018449 [Aromia moschata]
MEIHRLNRSSNQHFAREYQIVISLPVESTSSPIVYLDISQYIHAVVKIMFGNHGETTLGPSLQEWAMLPKKPSKIYIYRIGLYTSLNDKSFLCICSSRKAPPASHTLVHMPTPLQLQICMG